MRDYERTRYIPEHASGRRLSLRERRVTAAFLLFFIGSLTPPLPAPALIGPPDFARRAVVSESRPERPAPTDRGRRSARTATPVLADNAPATVAAEETPPPGPASQTDPAPQAAAAPQTPPEPKAVAGKIIAGWLPYWDISEGTRIISEFPDALNEVSPFWYEVDGDGRVKDSPGADNADLLRLLKEKGIRTIPTIMSADQAAVSGVINDPAKRKAHIRQIVSKIDTFGFDGIDIDYENLPAADRDVYSNFIRKLAKAVRKRGKILIVTVNSKTGEPGGWSGAQSHDYAALGEAADFVRVMAYDKHYAGGPPGPVAPIGWVEEVINFTLSKVPKEKFVLGIPAYGYDWPTQGRAKSVVHDEAAAKSLSTQAPVQWDAPSASSFFTYNDGSGPRTVWFENSRSVEAKADLAKKFDLAGVAIWRLGREDKTAYLNLKAKLNGP